MHSLQVEDNYHPTRFSSPRSPLNWIFYRLCILCVTIVECTINIYPFRNIFIIGWKELYMEIPHDLSQSRQKVIVREKIGPNSGSGSHCSDLPWLHLRSGEEAAE